MVFSSILGSNSRLGQVRKRIRQHEKKAFSQLSVQFSGKIVAFVKFPQSFDVIWKLLFAWRGVSCRLPFARHAPILVRACLPGNRSQHLQVKKIALVYLPAILLTIRKRRLLSLIAICTIPNFRCSSSFDEFLFVIASSLCGRSVLACFHGENVFLCEASSLFCESTEASEERNLYSCLEFVALEFEVHQRFTEIT